jgi:hypothetical protein
MIDIEVVYETEKTNRMIHRKISKWEIKDNLLYLYRKEKIEVVYNINKIISFYEY